MLRSSHFRFLVTFGNKVMKIRKYYAIFVYILQGKMGKTEKTRKESHSTKVTKILKSKRWKCGMNQTKKYLRRPLAQRHSFFILFLRNWLIKAVFSAHVGLGVEGFWTLKDIFNSDTPPTWALHLLSSFLYKATNNFFLQACARFSDPAKMV